MAVAGRKALIKVSGAPVAIAGEATTVQAGTPTPNTVYKITNPDHRILDPFAAITVYVDADGGGAGAPVVADPSTYTLDRLNGKVTFTADQGAAAVVTIDGSYLPLSTAAEAYEYSYSLESDNQESTSFQDNYVTRESGQKDVTGSLGKWHVDSYFTDALTSGNTLVLEFYADAAAGADMRCWAKLASDEISAAADGLVEESVDFEGTADMDGRVISFG